MPGRPESVLGKQALTRPLLLPLPLFLLAQFIYFLFRDSGAASGSLVVDD